MKYRDLTICGHRLGRYAGEFTDMHGLNRVCYGRPGHAGGHGHEGDCAELLMTDAEVAQGGRK